MKKLTAFAALICTLTLVACSDKAPKAAADAPLTEEQKTVYALGLLVSQSLKSFELTPEELALVQKGIAEGVSTTAKPSLNAEEYLPKVQELQKTRVAKANDDFLAKAAAEPGATKTATGIVIKHTKAGTGASPAASDVVKVHYEGRLVSGKVFDSSKARNEPATFPLDGVIPCWTEGVQTMKVGGTAQLVCPANLAYGDHPPPSIPPGSTLVFDVELLDITKPEPAKK